jgi:phosphosulfolactate synthase
MITISPREEKPRTRGLTSVLDKGLGYYAALDLVEQAAEYIDLVKLGWGTARLISEEIIKKKIAIFAGSGISVCNGGTLLELAYKRGRTREFFQAARGVGFSVIEVSNGVVPMGGDAKQKLIAEARSRGFDVMSEIGKKDPREDARLSIGDRVDEAKKDMEAGASRIVIEARESGKGLGIYDDSGGVKEDMVESLVDAIGEDNIIFEAPEKNQQTYLILHLGINVNLGNIRPDDVIPLETLRRGLRGDTLGKV